MVYAQTRIRLRDAYNSMRLEMQPDHLISAKRPDLDLI